MTSLRRSYCSSKHPPEQPREPPQGCSKKAVFGWRFVRLSPGLGFDGGKKLRCHHFYRSLKHALANACDRAPDLNVAVITDYGNAVPLLQVQIAGTLQEARLAFAVDNHSKVTRWPHIFKANVTGEQAFDRTDTSAKDRRVSILAGLFQALAAGYAPLQHRWIN